MLGNWNERSVVKSLYDPVPTYPKKSWFEPNFVGEYQAFPGYSPHRQQKPPSADLLWRGVGTARQSSSEKKEKCILKWKEKATKERAKRSKVKRTYIYMPKIPQRPTIRVDMRKPRVHS